MSGKNGSKKNGEKAGAKAEGSDLVPQEHGGAIYQGPPANPVAGTGRPPNEFRRRMRELVNREKVQEYLSECLEGEHGPQAFQRAVEFATDRGYGKAPQTVKVEDERTDEGYDSDRLWRAVKRLREISDLEKMLASGEVIEAEIVEEEDE